MSSAQNLSTSTVPRLYNALAELAKVAGPEASIRQLLILLTVASADAAGTEQETINRRVDTSPAATSRHLKNLAGNLQLVEYQVDPMDRRKLTVHITKQGKALLSKVHHHLYT